MRNKIVYIRLHVAEPLPVMGFPMPYQGDTSYSGPYYQGGSEWYTTWSPQAERQVEAQAEALRGLGYTTTVRVVER